MPDYSKTVIPFFTGSAGNPTGSTEFGYFDDDSDFITEAPKMANYIASRLGYPVHQIEITEEQVYKNIEWAMMEYSYIVHEYRTKENFFDLIGQPTSSNYTEKLVAPSMQQIIRLSEPYNLQAGVPKTTPIRTGSIDIVNGRQTYNLQSEYFSGSHPNEVEFSIQKMYHYRVPSARSYMNTIFNYPNSGLGVSGMGNDVTYTLLPMTWDITRMHGVNMHRELRLSDYSYQIKGNQLRMFPVPTENYTLFFEYYIGSEEAGRGLDNSIYDKEDRITNPSDITFNNLQFSRINQKDRTWITKYALAECMVSLGINRRKYSSIPYSNRDVSLDGDALVSEGETRKENLKQELREFFDKLSNEAGMDIKANIANRQTDILRKVPLGMYII